MNIVAYIRVSTEGQADGHGLDAQRSQIEAYCAHRGWTIAEVFVEVQSSTKNLPERARAIAMCESDAADGLVVTKLDRLSRGVVEFGELLGRANKKRWSLAILDLGVDTSTPMGEAMAHMAAVFAQLERRRISERTKEGLAAAKAKGVVLGRRHIAEELRDRIRAMRASGMTQWAIADRLNEEGVPTANGGALWRPSSFRRFL